MSGPKDFDIAVADSLLSLFVGYRAQQQVTFDTRMSTLRAPAAIRRNRPAPKAPLQARPSGQILPAIDENHNQSVAQKQAAQTAAAEAAREAVKAASIAEKIDTVLVELQARSTAIGELAHATTVCASYYGDWEQRRVAVDASPPTAETLAGAETLLAESEALTQRVLDVSQQLEQRRHVVKAVLESFHAVGYFTDEPVEEASRPGGPITLVARKGGERVTVSLPLGDSMIKSNWDGSADTRCLDSFEKYVTEMGKHGVVCTPSRAMEDRPRLQQMGRKDLPKSQSQGG